MATPSSLFVALKWLFITMTCIMAAALVYLLAMDHYSSCFGLQLGWMQVLDIDIIIYFLFIAAWFFYKESGWIKAFVFFVLVLWCGSFVTCGYIVIQFFKLSSEESSKDPLYFVLAGHQKGDIMGHRKQHSMVIAKVIVAVLGCYMLGILIYAFMINGMPFHMEILTPCMITGLIDIHIHNVVFTVWILYKESSWINAVLWILSVVCFGSVALCVYIARELFHLSPEQHVSFILFNKRSRDLMSSDPLLREHSDV
uniref:uncharacterized protein LOC122595925 n=1 Tax=Erigeron canadensis TaxID=72917 RepID=UPI001CB94266|nr:uncharacterized protein LOC122595925 [Erigeron canadensis]